jgi:hypothetical protein
MVQGIRTKGIEKGGMSITSRYPGITPLYFALFSSLFQKKKWIEQKSYVYFTATGRHLPRELQANAHAGKQRCIFIAEYVWRERKEM